MDDRMKKKLENILYYHKTKILAGIAAAALLAWGIFFFGGGSPETVLYGEAVNVDLSPETAEEACGRGLEALGKDPDREQILLETGMEIDTENPEKNASSGNLEKMTTAIFAHEIDFMICTPEVMEYYAEKDALEQMERGEAQGDAESVGDDAGAGAVSGYGIDITAAHLSDSGEKVMFCIFKNSEHKEEALEFAESLMQASDMEG